MKRCIELAKNGLGRTYPNPLVGCVIVWHGKIIGEGWHQKAGEPHAEVNAINSVKDKSKLKEATLYVSLEPCSHHGKTPPCSDLIVEKGLKNVVIGTVDPNPKVAGRGVKKLKQSCENVVVGCMEERSKRLNKRFFSVQRHQRPYIILKWAQTRDGFIAPENQAPGRPTWITNSFSKQLVHQWRTQEESILVGLNTVLKDNPRLNARLWAGKNPVRILIDPDLKSRSSSGQLHLFDQSVKTIVFCRAPRPSQENLIYEKLGPGKNTGGQIVETLYNHGLQSVIVEGGQKTLNTFIKADLWDEARVFTGNSYFHSGIKAPEWTPRPHQSISLKKDELKIYYND